MQDFTINSPTSVRKGYMVNSTSIRDHMIKKNSNPVRTNIFGESFKEGPFSSTVRTTGKDSFLNFDLPNYKKTRKTLFG
jgi:hypothetical protein